MHKCQVWKKEPKCSVLDTLGNGAKAAQEDRIRDIAEPWASQFLSIQKLVPDITGPRASLPRHWEYLLCCCGATARVFRGMLSWLMPFQCGGAGHTWTSSVSLARSSPSPEWTRRTCKNPRLPFCFITKYIYSCSFAWFKNTQIAWNKQKKM